MSHNRPHFLIIGAQKCGTSSLLQMLGQHPDISLPEHKEYHYFNRDLDWPDHAKYVANFPDDGKLTGEATPGYCFWPGALERIHEFNPDIKLIMLLRNPARRAISHYWMEFNRGFEDRPIEEALQPLDHRESSKHAKGLEYSLFYHSYLLRGIYHTQLDKVYKLFPRYNVFVGFLEDMADVPAWFVSGVLTFLRLDHKLVEIEPLKLFQGSYPEPSIELLHRLRDYYAIPNALLYSKHDIFTSEWRLT